MGRPLTRSESAQMAGVTEGTIEQYLDYGLLSEKESNRIAAEELAEVFNLKNLGCFEEELKLEEEVVSEDPEKNALVQTALHLKEKITSLLEERDWLRARLEKSELRVLELEDRLFEESKAVREILAKSLEKKSLLASLVPKKLLTWVPK